MIEKLWHKHKNDNHKNPTGFEALELVAMLERCLNFVYTGNPQVIASRLMNHMKVGKSLIRDGLPSFSKGVELNTSLNHKGMHVKVTHWPEYNNGVVPLASRKTHLHHYGPGALAVSVTC